MKQTQTTSNEEDIQVSEFDQNLQSADFNADLPEDEEIHFILDNDFCGQRLDKVLAQLMPEYSRSRIQQWIEDGCVLLNGESVKAKYTVLGEENIIVQPKPEAHTSAYEAENLPLEVVYQDQQLIVINKPAGLVVHPAAGNWSGTLLNALLFHFPELAHVPRAGIVHRLDKDTSGLMVVARTLAAQTELVRQLQDRSMGRQYYALVLGQPHLTGSVEAAIGRHPRERTKMAVSTHFSAKPAVTHYQRLAIGAFEKMPVSLVECTLETGRTHQIRVHMQHLGYPLIGDQVYGKPHLAKYFHRQALHAKRLSLIHPDTQDECTWEVALPDDFAALLAQAGIEIA